MLSRTTKARGNELAAVARAHQVPGFVDEDEFHDAAVERHRLFDPEHQRHQNRLTKRGVSGEALELKHRQAAAEVDRTARAVEPACKRTIEVGLELHAQVVKSPVVNGAFGKKGIEVGKGRKPSLHRRHLRGRGRELNEHAPLEVGERTTGRDEFAQNRHHRLDPFGAVVARKGLKDRKGIEIPDVFLVEDEEGPVEHRAGLFIGAPHVDDPDEPALREAAEGKLVHHDGLARTGLAHDRHRIVPARVRKGIHVHDLAASTHEREKRRPAVTVVADRRSLPLGHHG